ncbi:MAG TPA: DUF433 domain-containing protein [Phycisphaerae bacterium]|nr:DUF433 domain-containing protein [Phycisphaerae bacterium]
MVTPPDIVLPDFLTRVDGELRITGHRISLPEILWEYNEGRSAEELVLRFPTLKLATIHKAIAFYLDHQPDLDAYLAAREGEMEQQRAGSPASPSLAELQRRMEQIRRKAVNAAEVSH